MNYAHAASEAQVREITARGASPRLRSPQEAEGLHWALRTSFVALVSPRAWIEALFPERNAAHNSSTQRS